MSLSHKKPRLDDGDVIKAIQRGTIGDKLEAELESITSEEQLFYLEDKVQEMSTMIMKRMLALERNERAQLKTQNEEELRAVYQSEPPTGTPHLTIESAMVLLDSGFLTPEETGRLCLLTGKFFISGLTLAQHDHVWKNIFEAKFHASPHLLASLYQSHKFMQVLAKKGYQWMFRHFFAKGIASRSEDSDVVLANEYPNSVLNDENMFFIFLLASMQEGTAHKMNTVILVDDEEAVDNFVSSECCLSAPFHHDERTKRLKDLVDKNMIGYDGTSTNRLLDQHRIRFHFSFLAFRLDTYECTKLFETTTCFEYHTMEETIPTNGVGKEVLKRMAPNWEEYVLTLSYTWGISGENLSCETEFIIEGCSSGNDFRQDEHGFDLYKFLDYGIAWD